MPKDIKLFTLAKELNVGIGSFKDSLEKKNVLDVNTITPNTRVPREVAEQLIAEHGKGMGKAEIAALLDTLSGATAKPAPAKPAAKPEAPAAEPTPAKVKHIETVVPEDRRPSLNIKGSIATEKKAEAKPAAKAKAEPKPKPAPAPKAEAPAPEVKPEPKVEVKPEPKPEPAPAPAPKVEAPAPKAEPKPAPAPEPAPAVPEVKPEPKAAPAAEEPTVREPEIYRPSTPSAGISFNVVGKIDLSSINDNTRPAKKSAADKGRKRTRIGKGPVDVKAEAAKVTDNGTKKPGQRNGNGGNGGNGRSADPYNRGGRGNAQQGAAEQKTGRKAKRQSQQPQKAVVTDEDVQRQVKETLARLTGKNQQGAKSAKYRKDKRDAARSAALDAQERSEAESRTLKLTEFVTVSDLASLMDVPVTQVIATCMSIGLMVSINMRLDAETIEMVAEEFGYKTDFVSAEVVEAITQEEEVDDEADLISRPPIVTVMGHVDHGKTSLLDRLRNTNVIAGEAGGITQHIGAYSIRFKGGKRITFLDTPGHEAFTAMRARGAQVTDIVIIIIAADDSVMPTTKEAIAHAQAAGVPMVFAINKIDKPGANPDKIREDLSQMNLLVEEWGGKYQCQEISAKKGLGVNELLDKVLLEADMMDLKANPNRKATGTIIESSLDKGRGYVSTVLVSNGTLKIGDNVIAGTSWGRIKAMFNERNQRIESAGPAEPAIILGLNGAPTAGDTFHVMETEQEAREIANKREQLQREQGLRTQTRLTLSDISHRIARGEFHEMNIIVKGDTDGSIEALSDSFIKLSTEKVKVNVISKAVGQISENDVMLASASDAVIVGFQVRPSADARRLADREGVEINTYSVIYDAIDDVKSTMVGMLDKVKKEIVTGQFEVKQVFKISKVGTVAGGMVTEGKVHSKDKGRVVRDGIVIHTAPIDALKRYKDDVKEVATGLECGISLVNYNDLQVGDIIETFTEIEVEQKL